MRCSQWLAVAAFVVGGVSLAPSQAVAAPLAIDFDGAGVAAGEKVTGQFSAGGGPTFLVPLTNGFDAVACNPPHLSTTAGAHSGAAALTFDGCGGEFPPTGALFALGTSVQDLDVWLKGSSTIETFLTGFDANRTKVAQQRGFLNGEGGAFKDVSLHSFSGPDIAYVSIEAGDDTGTSLSGVHLAAPAPVIVADDLTLEQPALPPPSTFSLAVSPPSRRAARGTTVTSTVPITWFNEPSPSSRPVEFTLSAPPGVVATISPNPSNTGTATLETTIAPDAPLGAASVTVDGYVDRGLPGEKHATITQDLLIESPYTVQLPPNPPIAPCTPAHAQIRIPTGTSFSDPLQIQADVDNGVRITAVDGVPLPAPTARVNLTRAPNPSDATSVDLELVRQGTYSTPFGVPQLTARVQAGAFGTVTERVKFSQQPGSVTGYFLSGTSTPVTVASTPQLLRPGTRLRLEGSGFCPGATVQFGTEAARVAAQDVSPTGRSLTATVPRTAQTGAVLVLREGGGAEFRTAPGPTDLTVRSFRSHYAYPFKNRTVKNISIGAFADAFGEDDVYMKVDVCEVLTLGVAHCPVLTPIPNPHFAVVWGLGQTAGRNGLCFGMSLSEGKIATQGTPSDFPPFQPSASTFDLVGPDGPSPKLQRAIETEHVRQLSHEYINASAALDVTSSSGAGYAKKLHDTAVAALSDAKAGGPLGGRPPIVSVFDDGGGHAMLVYDVEDVSPGVFRLYVADPNVPLTNEELNDPDTHTSRELLTSILVDGTKDVWSYPWLQKEVDGKKVPWSDTVSGDSIQIVSPELQYRKKMSLPGLFDLVSGLIVVGSDGSRLDQVQDARGRTLLAPDGSRRTGARAIPGGAVVHPTEIDATNGPLAVLPTRGSYVVHATRARGGDGRLGAIDGPLAIMATTQATGQTATDALAVDPRHDAATLNPGTSGPTALTLSRRASGGASLTATLTGRTIRGAGSGMAMTGLRDVVVTHHGPVAPATLLLTTVRAGAVPISSRLPLGPLRAGERIAVTIGAATARVRRGGRTRTVPLQRTDRGQVTLRAVTTRVVKGRKITSRVTLNKTTARPVSAGITAVVLRGHHVVARASARAQDPELASRRPLLTLTTRALKPGRYRVQLLVTHSAPGIGGQITTRTRTLTRSVTVH